MPNTNGSQSLTKSMNGLIELEDGGGTVLSDGIVTTNEVITNEIQGQSVNDSITLYTNTTGNIDLRTFRFGNNTITTTLFDTLPVYLFTNQTGAGNIIIGNSLSRVFASSFRFRDNLMTVEFSNTLVSLFTTQTGLGSITLGNSEIRIRVGGFIFQNNTLNHLTPSNITSLFTTQTGSINIGNVTISTNIGSFQFTNNAFNLNFFLNETCKDAMNISDFVSSIKVNLADLENTGRQGYIEGITNIVLKNLNKVEQNMRPIHCSDLKREVFYIKENNEWQKENEEKPILTKAIKVIANENIKQIKSWQDKYPDCSKADSKKNNLFLKIVSNSMNGSTQEEANKNIDKIISNVAKEVTIDKSK